MARFIAFSITLLVFASMFVPQALAGGHIP